MTTPPPNPPAPPTGPISGLLAAILRLAGTPAVWLAAATGLVVSLTGLVVLVFALPQGEVTIALFQVVVIPAGLVPLGLALGRFGEGPGLALLCAASAPIVSSVLSEPTIITGFLGAQGQPVRLGPLPLPPVMLAQLGGGLLIAAAAAVKVWSALPAASAAYLVRSAATGVPLVAMLAALVVGPVRAQVAALPGMVKMVGFIALFFIGLTLVSIAGHCLIRSFEVASREDGPGGSGAGAKHAPTA